MAESILGELVSFETPDGLTLHGFLVRSKRKSDKAVIHVHGLEGTFYRSNFARVFARKLSNNGFNFLSIEQRGSYTALGIRRGKEGRKSWYTGGGAFERFEDCVYDIDGAINFLAKQGIKRIYLEGHSTGCQKITYYQYRRKNRKVKALILTAPGDDYNVQRAKMGKGFKAAVETARRLVKSDRTALLPKKYVKRPYAAARFLSYSDLGNVEARIFNYESDRLREFGAIREPILAMFGSKDESLLKPAGECLDILKRNSGSANMATIVINNADHGFDGRENYTTDAIIGWLKRI